MSDLLHQVPSNGKLNFKADLFAGKVMSKEQGLLDKELIKSKFPQNVIKPKSRSHEYQSGYFHPSGFGSASSATGQMAMQLQLQARVQATESTQLHHSISSTER